MSCRVLWQDSGDSTGRGRRGPTLLLGGGTEPKNTKIIADEKKTLGTDKERGGGSVEWAPRLIQ